MGIKQLSKVLETHAKESTIQRPLTYYTGFRIAIDASLSIYQFMISVRSNGQTLQTEYHQTSHLVGLFNRTIKMLQNNIKPIYIFDGHPPELKKSNELQKRLERRETAKKEYQLAKEQGDLVKMEKYDKRQMKVTEEHVTESQTLLKLLNIPFYKAKSEAEAFCAFLCKENIVDCVSTEDMDCLTFGAPIMVRNLFGTQTHVTEINLKKVLQEMNFTMDMFIDMCILLGCDYIPPIKNVGPKRAYEFVKKHKSIERIVEKERNYLLKYNSQEFLEGWNYEGARQLFTELSTEKCAERILVPKYDFSKVDEEKVIEFLVGKHNFSKERVLIGLEKLKKIKIKGKQPTLGAFFQKIEK